MSEINSQSQYVGDRWSTPSSRTAGLYGELQPLPLPVQPSGASVLKRKNRNRQAAAD